MRKEKFMGDNTKIEWCDETWNPVTGCSPISEGCQNCYAARMANRLRGRFGYPEDEPFRPGIFHHDKMKPRFEWMRKRKRIFVCSMGDLFHDDVDSFNQFQVINKIHDAQWQHDFILLTKRPQNMKNYFANFKNSFGGSNYNYYNKKPERASEKLWLGVTAENQKRADERIPILLQIPAIVRFVSIEPMLGPVNLKRLFLSKNHTDWKRPFIKDLQWVIAGPESGPGARECKPEWIEDLYEQCQAAGVPFFDKRKKNWLAREFPKS